MKAPKALFGDFNLDDHQNLLRFRKQGLSAREISKRLKKPRVDVEDLLRTYDRIDDRTSERRERENAYIQNEIDKAYSPPSVEDNPDKRKANGQVDKDRLPQRNAALATA